MKQYAKTLVLMGLALLGGCNIAVFLPHPVSMDGIPWGEPKELSLTHCPDIDGVYKANFREGIEYSFGFLRIFEGPYFPYDRVMGRVIKEDVVNKPKTQEEISDELRNTVMDIRVKGDIVKKIIMHKSGKVYRIRTVRLEPQAHPKERSRGVENQVGCHNGKYIVRKVFTGSSNEGSDSVYRAWEEIQLEKLPDGSLKMHTTRKEARIFKEIKFEEYTSIFREHKP